MYLYLIRNPEFTPDEDANTVGDERAARKICDEIGTNDDSHQIRAAIAEDDERAAIITAKIMADRLNFNLTPQAFARIAPRVSWELYRYDISTGGIVSASLSPLPRRFTIT